MFEFEWDEGKNKINLNKHKIDFKSAEQIWDDPSRKVFRGKTINGEERYKIIGLVATKCYAGIFTIRQEKIRLISVRPASQNERKLYGEK